MGSTLNRMTLSEVESSLNQVVMQLPMINVLEARIVDTLGQVASATLYTNIHEPTYRPTNGTVQVDPLEGIAHQTQFVVQLLDNWNLDGDTNLFFRIWGVKGTETEQISETIWYMPN